MRSPAHNEIDTFLELHRYAHAQRTRDAFDRLDTFVFWTWTLRPRSYRPCPCGCGKERAIAKLGRMPKFATKQCAQRVWDRTHRPRRNRKPLRLVKSA